MKMGELALLVSEEWGYETTRCRVAHKLIKECIDKGLLKVEGGTGDERTLSITPTIQTSTDE
jgi:hypothetical protein